MEVLWCQKSKKDGTMKFLMGIDSNCEIELVLMCLNTGWM